MSRKLNYLVPTAGVLLCGILPWVGCKPTPPRESDGAEPRHLLTLATPEDTIESNVDVSGTIKVSAGRQNQTINTGMTSQVLCTIGKTPDDETRGTAECRFGKTSFTMNNISASSSDPPSRHMHGFSPLSDTPEDRARRMLSDDLKRLVNKVVIKLEYGPDFTNPTVSGLEPPVIDGFSLAGKPLLQPYSDPRAVVSAFIAESALLLPDHPVGVGAVWHVTLPNAQMPELPVETAVTFKSLSRDGEDQIAHLATSGVVQIPGPKTINTPAGDRVRVRKLKIRTSGKILFNLSQQREESSRTVIEGSYVAEARGQKAHCTLSMTTSTKRRHSTTVAAVVKSLAEKLSGIAAEYPELAEYNGKQANRGSSLFYSQNFVQPDVKRGIKDSDFGENGCLIKFVTGPIPANDRIDAMTPPTFKLSNLGLYLWTEIRTGAAPSDGFEAEVGELLHSHAARLQAIDKAAAARI